jgi:hypothetical protein
VVREVCAGDAARTREEAEECDGVVRIDGLMARIKESVALASYQRQLAHLAALCAWQVCAKSRAFSASTTEPEEKLEALVRPAIRQSVEITTHSHNGHHKHANAAEHPQSICSSRSLRPHISPPRRTTIASPVLGPRPLASCVIRCYDFNHPHTVANTTAHMG